VKLVEHSVTDLLAAFRSSSPTPGGGSAAALSGAVGASLLAMVAGLPKSRASNDEDASNLSSAGARCTALANELAALIEMHYFMGYTIKEVAAVLAVDEKTVDRRLDRARVILERFMKEALQRL